MPWIQLLIGPDDLETDTAQQLADETAQVAAHAVGLSPQDVVVLVQSAAASSGPGALMHIAGRRRDEATELFLQQQLRQTVAARIGCDVALVVVVRH